MKEQILKAISHHSQYRYGQIEAAYNFFASYDDLIAGIEQSSRAGLGLGLYIEALKKTEKMAKDTTLKFRDLVEGFEFEFYDDQIGGGPWFTATVISKSEEAARVRGSVIGDEWQIRKDDNMSEYRKIEE